MLSIQITENKMNVNDYIAQMLKNNGYVITPLARIVFACDYVY